MSNIISFNAETCTGCGSCVKTCPEIVFESNGSGKPVKVARPELCLGCMACEEDCAVGAIHVYRLPDGMQEKDIPAPLSRINTEKIYDLVIVGAGPAGLAAAIRGRMLGLDLVVLDRLPSARRSHHPDGGLIMSTPELYDLKETPEGGLAIYELGLQFPPDMIRGRLHHFILMGPEGISTRRKRGIPGGFVVVWKDRFVEVLFERAIELGAAVAWNSRVRKIFRNDGLSRIEMENGSQLKARAVISAEGITGRLAQAAGVDVNEKHMGWSFGVMADMPAFEKPLDECGFAVGNPDASKAYPAAMAYWASGSTWTELMPGTLQKERYRVGERPLHECIKDWLEKDPRLKSRFGCTPEMPKTFNDGCRVYLRRNPKSAVGDGIIAVGDAITSCGMISNIGAVKTGDIAASVLADALRSGNLTAEGLSAFDRRIKKLPLIEGMNWMFGPLMGAPMNLSPEKLKDVFKLLSHLELSVVQGGGRAAAWEMLKFFVRIMPGLLLRPDIRPYLTGGK